MFRIQIVDVFFPSKAGDDVEFTPIVNGDDVSNVGVDIRERDALDGNVIVARIRSKHVGDNEVGGSCGAKRSCHRKPAESRCEAFDGKHAAAVGMGEMMCCIA
mmetsp:Transcript_3828/g.8441  ORF Transcript_3828/g.8441 Transcript_3828/m.8441 type:complete len:103 (-) Transcript_3828:63-371(-)